MKRITDKDLQNVVDRINKATNSPMTPYERNGEGKSTAQIGNFHLYYAYGRVGLHRMYSLGGGVTTPIDGLYTKRELLAQMYSFLNGLEFNK